MKQQAIVEMRRRFDVRDCFGGTLREFRSEPLALSHAKAARRTSFGEVQVFRVETFGNVTRERLVARY